MLQSEINSAYYPAILYKMFAVSKSMDTTFQKWVMGIVGTLVAVAIVTILSIVWGNSLDLAVVKTSLKTNSDQINKLDSRYARYNLTRNFASAIIKPRNGLEFKDYPDVGRTLAQYKDKQPFLFYEALTNTVQTYAWDRSEKPPIANLLLTGFARNQDDQAKSFVDMQKFVVQERSKFMVPGTIDSPASWIMYSQSSEPLSAAFEAMGWTLKSTIHITKQIDTWEKMIEFIEDDP